MLLWVLSMKNGLFLCLKVLSRVSWMMCLSMLVWLLVWKVWW